MTDFLAGLCIGVWLAALAWIWRYAVGYKAGIKFCMKELEPVKVEVAQLAGLHHVTEEMRQAIQAAQEGHGETRH